ncbi:diaminopimelate decarboxylase, partial [bacterium]|nr:diaminopimelate decarboxylase [bacterium]
MLSSKRVVYATKAFLCGAMARLAHEEGLLLDVATGGELFVALNAGVPGSACVMHGNNKSTEELEMALDAGVQHIVVDNFDELDRLDAIFAKSAKRARIQLRITPGVAVHTHEFVSTGQDDSKFGFNLRNGDAQRAVDRARSSTSVEFVGIHCHI